ncbi:MAG TPA: hypothetical protein VIV40_36055 [Kofleriaceae bacterium]
MKRAMVVITLLGLTAQANADNREAWQAVFAGSVTVAVGGVVMYVHGATKVDDARDELCARGAYPYDAHCPQPSTYPTITQADIDRLNAKGDRGAVIANLGAATTGIGVIVAGIALYKGFIAKPKKQESAVVVTPTVSKDGAGAALQLRW